MAHLTISHIGPIKSIDIELNKINVFLGPQSSGKSTIAKIISFCQWMQKDVVEHQGVDHIDDSYIQESLIGFHRLNGYFDVEKSEFHYIGRCADIHYAKGKLSVVPHDNIAGADVSKNAYIPSERNIIGIPQSLSMELDADYIRSFLGDWLGVRTKFDNKNLVKMPGLGVSYYYQESSGEDMIMLEGTDSHSISLSQSSSGLQSVVPLYVYMKYLTDWIYNNKEPRSPKRIQEIREVSARETLKEELSELWGKEKYQHRLEDLTSQLAQLSGLVDLSDEKDGIIRKFKDLESRLSKPKFSNIVLEEPEQNLFPQTQADLIYALLEMINSSRHNLVITTHSPFVIYAINNCMMAFAAGERLKLLPDLVLSSKAVTDPATVSVWELRDGYLQAPGRQQNQTIQDDNGLLRGNYFDRVMQGLMTDFKNILSVSR